MSERDVMTLLADANPVRVEDLPQTGPFSKQILERRRRPSGRVVLVTAVVLAGATAGVIGVLATGGHGAKTVGGPEALSNGPDNGSWKTIPLAEASAALGAPVRLPNTDLVQPSDAAQQARTADCSASSCAVYVSFPAQALGISYTHPSPFGDPSAQWEADVRTAGSHHARVQLLDLNGTPGDYVDYPGVKRLVEFVAGGTWIVVSAEYNEATLEAVAQSIVDQAPSQPVGGAVLGVGSPPTIDRPLPGGKEVPLATAAAAFGAPVVQPATSVVSPSDAGAVWLLADRPYVRTVDVTYPRADVWIAYTWPASYDGGYNDQLLRYHAHNSMTHTVLLDGVPAQVVFHSWKQQRWSGFYPSVHFVAGGVNVAIWGRQDKGALEAIARSIVARSQSPPAGQLGDVGGVQVYPYLAHGRQISLSEASATLGSPVVLPDSSLARTGRAQAWAEGTCPHPAADLATTEVCAVWISFPDSTLSLGYIRPPAYLGTGPEWRLQARGLGRNASAVRLDGTPALSIHRNPGAGYPGRVALDLDGTRVVVAGDYSPARLQEVARSIVDRSGAQ